MRERKPDEHRTDGVASARPRAGRAARRRGMGLALLLALAGSWLAQPAGASPTEVERSAARQRARVEAADTALRAGGVPSADVERVRRAIEAHLVALPEIALVTVLGDTSRAYDVLAWTKHSTFDACVLSEHPTTRDEFENALESCGGDLGIEGRVVRLAIAPNVPLDAATDVHSSRLEATEVLDGETRMRVVRMGLVDLNRDGRSETWAHVVEERVALEYAEADEETRDEPEEIEVVTYHAVLRTFSADGYDLPPIALTGDGTERVATSAFALRTLAPRRFELVYTCATGERTRGCRRGERHVPVRVDFDDDELDDDS